MFCGIGLVGVGSCRGAICALWERCINDVRRRRGARGVIVHNRGRIRGGKDRKAARAKPSTGDRCGQESLGMRREQTPKRGGVWSREKSWYSNTHSINAFTTYATGVTKQHLQLLFPHLRLFWTRVQQKHSEFWVASHT